MKKRKTRFQRIFSVLLTLSYIFCIGLLIVESALPGNISSGQSNAVGGTIADIINQNKGDQYKEVQPTAIHFQTDLLSEMEVSQTQQLNYIIEPKDCTFQSVLFQTSNPEVLEISPTGLLTAKKEGKAEISISVNGYPEIKDTKEINVNNVLAKGITSTIPVAQYKENFYELIAGKAYHIETSFNPENTTDKTLFFSCSTLNYQDYFNLSKEGDIIAYKSTKEDIFTIQIKTNNDITNAINIKIVSDDSNLIPLRNMSFKDTSSYILPVGASVNVNSALEFQINYEPLNTSYKTFSVTSDNPDVIEIKNTTIKGCKEGVANLTFTSLYNKDISISKKVTVLYQPLEKFAVTVCNSSAPILFNNQSCKINIVDKSSKKSSLLSLGKNHYIKHLTINGQTLDQPYKDTYVSIDNNLTLTCLSPVENHLLDFSLPQDENGTTRLSFQLKITVKDATYEDYQIKNTLGQKIELDSIEYYLPFFDQPISLSSKITLNYKNNSTSLPLKYALSIEDKYKDIITLNDDVLTMNTAREYNFIPFSILCSYQDQYERTYSFLAGDDFSITSRNKSNTRDLSLDGYSLYANEFSTFDIVDNSTNPYHFELSGDTDVLSFVEEQARSISLQGEEEGILFLSATPFYLDTPLTFLKKTIQIEMKHIYSTGFSLTYFDAKTGKEIKKQSDGRYHIYLNTFLKPQLNFLNIQPTKFNFTHHFTSGAHYQNGMFQFDQTGFFTLRFKETITDEVTEDTFVVEHKTALKKDKPFEIIQKDGTVTYDEETKYYAMENGIPGKFQINFTSDSSYSKVSYQSEDKSIAAIGSDGVITPTKVGKTTLQAEIDNGFNFHEIIKISLEIKPKNYIRDKDSFFYKIRKGLCHFGAFLVFAICSVLFFTINVDKKYWCFSIPFAFLQGYGIAALTEFIQVFTAGRYGCMDDVLLDFTGFAIGGGITALIMLMILFIPKLIKLYRKKKNKTD